MDVVWAGGAFGEGGAGLGWGGWGGGLGGVGGGWGGGAGPGSSFLIAPCGRPPSPEVTGVHRTLGGSSPDDGKLSLLVAVRQLPVGMSPVSTTRPDDSGPAPSCWIVTVIVG